MKSKECNYGIVTPGIFTVEEKSLTAFALWPKITKQITLVIRKGALQKLELVAKFGALLCFVYIGRPKSMLPELLV